MDIKVTFPGGKRVNAEFGGHVVATDQPAVAGGDDSAPAPYDLFQASLATCAGIFALGFCQSRGISTEGLEVKYASTWDREAKRLARVDIEVVAPPGFPEKYLPALKHAVDLCTVKRTIHDPPELAVVTRVSDRPAA